jgi:integrase
MAESTQRVPVPGHPGIYKKGSRYVVRYRHHGKLHSKSFRTLSEAKRFKGKVDSGDTQPTSKESFQSYATRWLDEYSGRTVKGLSDSTRASYKDAIERVASPYFKTTPLERIDPPMLRKFINHLEKQGLAPNSVRRMYAPVRALLATAYEDGWLKTNPATGVRVIVKDTRQRTPKWLTAEQTKELLAEIPAEHRDLAMFLATTGARISEALTARWQDIGQDESGQIVWTVSQSKTEAGLRQVALSPNTARELMLKRSTSPYAGSGDLIFPTRTGTLIDPRNWRRRVVKRAAERAGVPWATPHKLRHGLASLMANQGYSAAQIAAHLGHADGGITALRTYIHPDRLQSAEWVDQHLG